MIIYIQWTYDDFCGIKGIWRHFGWSMLFWYIFIPVFPFAFFYRLQNFLHLYWLIKTAKLLVKCCLKYNIYLRLVLMYDLNLWIYFLQYVTTFHLIVIWNKPHLCLKKDHFEFSLPKVNKRLPKNFHQYFPQKSVKRILSC